MPKRIRNSSPEIQIAAKDNRKVMTSAEELLWNQLRSRRLGGFKFRRQHPVGRFVLDFYCPEAKLVVEVDGGYHISQRARDQVRTDEIAAYQIEVLRYSNMQVKEELAAVLESILKACILRTSSD